MQIKSLELSNFRNYDFLSVRFDEKTNIIYGSNAQGKTNILESIYLCASGKSLRGSKEGEMIKDGTLESHVKGEFSGALGKERVDIHLRKKQPKGIALNQIPIKKISDLYGKIKVVIFSEEDLEIIKQGPSARRRFMDMEICQLDKLYVEDLINYTKAKDQRNELLKEIERSDPEKKKLLLETLDLWDLQLAEYGKKVIKRRRKFIEEINSVINEIHSQITEGKEDLKIIYKPSSNEESLYEDTRKNREKDLLTKTTNSGPHRDDLEFYSNLKDMKVFGSNGQQKTCALSLKLSEINIIEKTKKEKPILLLDDVLSELDRNRQRQLLRSLKDIQTIITCTGIDEFIEQELGETKKFLVRDGKIEEE